MTMTRRFGWTALALFALVGCEPAAPTVTPVPATPTPPVVAPGEVKPPSETKALPVEPTKPGASVEKLDDKEIAEIMKMPAEDQKIALAQILCPVSGGHLGEGGMGAPIKQVVDGQTFFICCASCEKDVKADPKAVLAKLKK